MEEKERYELNDNDCIIDNEKGVAICDVCDVSESPETLVDLLNQQDKRIKELEQDKTKLMDLLNSMTENWWVSYEKNKKLRQENQQLKQQLHELPKKIVEEIKNSIRTRYPFTTATIGEENFFESVLSIQIKSLSEILDTILKKYGGENE